MNFNPKSREEPEINLIPFIDVLLVILIFLMLSTTYSKFTQLQINLPVADVEAMKQKPQEVIVTISREGHYSVNNVPVPGNTAPNLLQALFQVAQSNKNSLIVISADAQATHQAVMTALESTRRAGLAQVTFAARAPAAAGQGS